MLAFGERPISLLGPPPGGRADRLLARVGPYPPVPRACRQQADRLLFELIAERRADPAAVERDDILAMLLGARHEDGTVMSDEEIRDELLTMLVAGHETTASSLAWSLEQLSRHPQAMRTLREEIDAGGDAYLTATIQETLRHRPVLPNNAPRYVVQEIEVGGWRYPEGVCLVPNAYLIHHDPELYPDPYAFRPERFLGERPGTYTWIPFGGGRRRCLGASFALLEMQIVLRRAAARVRACAPAGEGFELARRRNITDPARCRSPRRAGGLSARPPRRRLRTRSPARLGILVGQLGQPRRVALGAGDQFVGRLLVALGQEARLHPEVHRLRVVGDDRQRRLLGLDGVAAGQPQADRRRVEQAEDLLVLGLLGAGGVAPASSAGPARGRSPARSARGRGATRPCPRRSAPRGRGRTAARRIRRRPRAWPSAR